MDPAFASYQLPYRGTRDKYTLLLLHHYDNKYGLRIPYPPRRRGHGKVSPL